MMLKKFSFIPRFFFASEAVKSVQGNQALNSRSQATSHC